MDWSYAVWLQSINIWVSPGPVAIVVAPFRCQKLDLIGPENTKWKGARLGNQHWKGQGRLDQVIFITWKWEHKLLHGRE